MINSKTWMEIPKEIRVKLREIFTIPQSSFTWVDGFELKSDGITDKDLEALSDAKMQDFSGISGTSEEMLRACIEKISIPLTDTNIEKTISEEIIKDPSICNICNYKGKNERSIKIHKGKYHKS